MGLYVDGIWSSCLYNHPFLSWGVAVCCICLVNKGGRLLYRKQCLRCMNLSYSSSNFGKWQCPYCANDLTDFKAKVVNHAVNLSSIDEKLNQQRGLETYRQIHISLSQRV